MYSKQWTAYLMTIFVVLAVGVRAQIEQFIDPEADAGLAGDAKHDAEVKLRHALSKNYAIDVLPPHNITNPVIVEIGLSVVAIIDLDAKKQVLASEGWVKLTWNDSRLVWNPAKYEGIELIRIEDKTVWKPDIMLYNGIQGFQGKPNGDVLALLYSHGTIMWIPPLSFKSYCPIDLKYYPYDEHECFLKFGSWVHSGLELNITYQDKDEPDLSDAYDSGEWDIKGGRVTRNDTFYSCCKEPYPDVTFFVSLVRRSPFYKVAILCPVISATLLMMTSLWMSSVARKRITLNVTSLFLLVGTALFLVSRIPAVGRSIPIIGVTCGVLIIVNVLMTIATILFSTIARNRRNQPVPNFIRSVIGGKLAAILLVPQSRTIESLNSTELTAADESQISEGKLQSGTSDNFHHWISFFQLVDRVAFVIFTLVIVIMLIASSA